MLLSKEVEMKVDWASVKRYESLGYGKMKQGDLFFIKVEDLKPNSLQLVDVSCDYCNVEFKRRYSEYIRNTKIQGKFSCLKCTNNKYKVTCLNKYGIDNISKLPTTHDKIRETSIERYGETYLFSKELLINKEISRNMQIPQTLNDILIFCAKNDIVFDLKNNNGEENKMEWVIEPEKIVTITIGDFKDENLNNYLAGQFIELQKLFN